MTPAELYSFLLPEEISNRFERLGCWPEFMAWAPRIPYRVVTYFLKSHVSRAVAWRYAQQAEPPSLLNPWRKAHTEHYWCWYIPAKDDDV